MTGMDEDDPKISELPTKEEREKEKKRRKDKRTALEAVTGLDLKGLNFDFYDNLAFELYQGKVYNTENPHDEIAITCMKRKGEVAFGRDEIWNPECRDIEFYLETEEGAKLGNSTHRKKKTRAIAELYKILENKERLFNVAYYLNLTPKKDETVDELEDKLTLFIESDDINLEKFINTASMDNDRLGYINLFKKATKSTVVAFEPKTKVYFRGNMIYKSTVEESVDYLMLPDNIKELNEIAEAVAKKEKGKTIYA